MIILKSMINDLMVQLEQLMTQLNVSGNITLKFSKVITFTFRSICILISSQAQDTMVSNGQYREPI
uniref:Uncharacterized protein n=1 Tax=Heterorhabditis bacteriophora TaxID=37862 RepID=A0A1I7XI72_HETBA